MSISVEDKGKGKRIIMQFFKTMPNVQRGILTLFEKDEYEGIQHLQKMLYPESNLIIDSVDNLRKGLSKILQHIYSIPFEDKEGYFLEIMKCKTSNEVVRKEKKTLINHFYGNHPKFKDYLTQVLLDDENHVIFTQICKELLGGQEEIRDFRNFRNNLKELRDALTGKNEDTIVENLKKKIGVLPSSTPTPSPKLELASEGVLSPPELGSPFRLELVPQDASPKASSRAERADEYSFSFVSETDTSEKEASSPVPSSSREPGGLLTDSSSEEEKRKAIETVLSGSRYEALRRILLKTAVPDPEFTTFQGYLDNILSPSERIVANTLDSFSRGLEKIKAFRDNLEKELS